MIIPINRLYFVRHGETDANKQGLMCGGQWDIDLNDTGHSQAKAAVENFKGQELDIKHVVCSPLRRTQSTAQYFSDVFNAPITVVNDLREWHLGDWDRKPSREISPRFDANIDPPNGETVQDFHDRVVRALVTIRTKYPIALIVSHGAVWKRICLHLGKPYFQIENCKIVEV